VEQARAASPVSITYLPRAGVPGLNSGRNTGIAAAAAPLIVLVDDDVDAPPRWLREMVDGAQRHPDACAFGGPIELRLEGSRLRMCGREQPPITTLDGGPRDREIELVWGANMAFDRRALELAGEFDPGVPYGFDEDMWERRLRSRGGRIFYIAAAGLVHRRDPSDSRLRSLLRESYRRGRNLRAYSERRGDPPSLAQELRVLAGCLSHGPRYRCGNGLLLSAHSLGRVRTALVRKAGP
jgi:GT2 family glycosyltransferase